MTALARRKVLQGGAALAVTAVAVSVGAKSAQADDETLMDLWRRFMEAEARFSQITMAEDETSSAARMEIEALSRPWRYCGPPDGCVSVPVGANETRALPWHSSPSEMRFTAYPSARNRVEAREMSLAREATETRAYRAKVGWIRRKHGLAELERAVEAASEICVGIRCEIARVPVTGALAVAIKLALWAYDDCLTAEKVAAGLRDNEGCYDTHEDAALWSAYEWAAKACGYDPLAGVYDAIGFRPRTPLALAS